MRNAAREERETSRGGGGLRSAEEAGGKGGAEQETWEVTGPWVGRECHLPLWEASVWLASCEDSPGPLGSSVLEDTGHAPCPPAGTKPS